MNTGIPKLLEAHFGPESDLINVADFVKTALEEQSTCIQDLERQWSAVSDDRRALLANECRQGLAHILTVRHFLI